MEHPAYSPLVRALLAQERRPPLGPGQPQLAVRSQLETLTVEALAAPDTVQSVEAARACLAGLWLHFDFLDESHVISQELHTPDGSYWHALMHRREPDFANSKYWFRRVGSHPVFPELARHAAALAQAEAALPPTARFLLAVETWDPFAFVDLCAACGPRPTAVTALCEQIRLLEWRLLFAHGYIQVRGGNQARWA